MYHIPSPNSALKFTGGAALFINQKCVILFMPARKPLYQLSLHELAELMQPVDTALRAQKLEKGLYNVYSGNTANKAVLIRDYADKTEEVHVNFATGHTRTLRRRIK